MKTILFTIGLNKLCIVIAHLYKSYTLYLDLFHSFH